MILVFFLSFINIMKTFELNDYQNAINNANDEEYSDIELWKKEDYPNPSKKRPYCGGTKPSLVCDPDQLLTRIEGK
jgi:hypothetical protein